VRAASLAAELNEAGHEASIEEGGKGQYDVLADGELLFSKQTEGRFPDSAEVRGLLSSAPLLPEAGKDDREEAERNHDRGAK
jgi:hypothetical protein